MNIPRIISTGAPPEEHADRVTAEMVKFIVRLRDAVWAKGMETIAPSAMGNPTSQAPRREVAQTERRIVAFRSSHPRKARPVHSRSLRNHGLGQHRASSN
jgi:hypothetical protein